MKKILLVGCGHMGSALLNSWLKNSSYRISVVDPKTYKIIKRKYRKKILCFKSVEDISHINKFNAIIFAVKPQIAKNVVSKFPIINNKNILFISIIAGKKINFFEKNLKKSHQIIRAMTNMPAFVEQGMTYLVANSLTSNRNKILASCLFKFVGKIIWSSKELDIDKVTAISGSGPAYYYLFIEHFINEATKLGLKPKLVEELVHQTAYGSINLLIQGNKKASELRKNIAVKGGTTEAAINIFEKKLQLKKIIGKAITAAYNRSRKLGDS